MFNTQPLTTSRFLQKTDTVPVLAIIWMCRSKKTIGFLNVVQEVVAEFARKVEAAEAEGTAWFDHLCAGRWKR